MGNKPSKESTTSKRRIAVLERDVKALELRKAGANYVQIAAQLGMKYPSTAMMALRRQMERLRPVAMATELRELEAIRLDAIWLRLWQRFQANPSDQVVRSMMQVMERRARLLGLDAPVQHEVSGPDGQPIQVEAVDITSLRMRLLNVIQGEVKELPPGADGNSNS